MKAEYTTKVTDEEFARWWMNRGWIEVEEATGRAWSTYDDYTMSQRPIKAGVAQNCEAVMAVYRRREV